MENHNPLLQMPGESEISYHKRLVYGKLEDRTLADIDYGELSIRLYGRRYSPDVARRMLYGSKKTLDALGANHIETITGSSEDIDKKILELKKEQQKFYDQRAALKKSVRDIAREEEINEIIRSTISSGVLPELNYTPAIAQVSNNDLLVSLNDIHYGANVDNTWNKYDSQVCAEMFGRYIDRIVEIAARHDSENCICWMNGDAISGNIHYSIAVTNKEDVIEQIIGVSELVSDFLAVLSTYFKNVYFVSVAGNHSRINPNKNMTLTSERLDDLIEWYADARLQNFPNIHIIREKIDNTMYAIDIRGKTYCGVHGDYDLSQTSIQSLQTMIGKPLYAVLSGHLHHNKIDSIQGIKTVMAGSFLGMDEYCVQKRIVGSPEQLVCVCDKNGIVCSYDIKL